MKIKKNKLCELLTAKVNKELLKVIKDEEMEPEFRKLTKFVDELKKKGSTFKDLAEVADEISEVLDVASTEYDGDEDTQDLADSLDEFSNRYEARALWLKTLFKIISSNPVSIKDELETIVKKL